MSDETNVPSEANRIRLRRLSGGQSRNKRPLYRWEWVCPCGKRGCANVGKAETVTYALDHLQDHGLPRRKRYVYL